jgi:hypothetical protein
MYEPGMSARVSVICRTGWQRLVKQLARWWLEPRPLPRAALRSLEIRLCPSPLACRVQHCLLGTQLLFAAELGWTGHWPGSACTLMLALGWWLMSRRWSRRSGRQLRRLVIAADGGLFGLVSNGEVVELRLHPSSLSLGNWLLLRVVEGRHRHLLVLGPDNVVPSALAELRRRVAASGPTC